MFQFGISTGDNVSYQVQTNSLRITSRVRILQPAEPREERYVCSVVCGLDTYIVSCTVIALSQNSKSDDFLLPLASSVSLSSSSGIMRALERLCVSVCVCLLVCAYVCVCVRLYWCVLMYEDDRELCVCARRSSQLDLILYLHHP